MNPFVKYVAGILIIILLLVAGMGSFVTPYRPVAEVLEDVDYYHTHRVQMVGVIEKGSFKMTEDGYSFRMTDGNASVDVIFNGDLPSPFDTEGQVVAIGYLDEDGGFRASGLLTKCPSKYDQVVE